MRKRLACLHAHYSNIEYIENALSNYTIELVHFVDPALMYRVTNDESFTRSDAENKVKEQIEWIAQNKVDAILITCTNYIALLQEDELSISTPIIKIDEPFFDYICSIQQPQTILFTNPATVDGTLGRLYDYANTKGQTLDVEAVVIHDTFELIMQGRKEEYNLEISKFLRTIIENENRVISVAQLSMVEASEQVEYKRSGKIINPLDTLVTAIIIQLGLEPDRHHM
ncbi:hypothetical protein [Paenibacillus glacialis]|uniref:Asp/Glu racemase n=1 Tax=Paenibacillus glacialis TaxID=494026 RepID=A0A168NXL1_9BACL|nr:hypothetical protein [Paenibacillus glacialis]OAB46195.1 hypothetical protein PGLA_02095 [Paenibacillus glacialis]